MKNQRFNVNAYGVRLVNLLVCFSLLILIFSSVIPAVFQRVFAGSDESDHEGAPQTGDGGHVEGLESGDGGQGGSPGTGDEGQGGSPGSPGTGDEGDEGPEDTVSGDQGSNDALIATQLGNCRPGEERDIFTDVCQPIENPGNPATTSSQATLGLRPPECTSAGVIPSSYSHSFAHNPTSHEEKIVKGYGIYRVADPELMPRSTSPNTADDPLAGFGQCKIERVKNPDNTYTSTVTYKNNAKAILTSGKVTINGVPQPDAIIQEELYDPGGSLRFSFALGENGARTDATAVFIDGQKTDAKAFQVKAPDGTPIMHFVVKSDGKITPIDGTQYEKFSTDSMKLGAPTPPAPTPSAPTPSAPTPSAPTPPAPTPSAPTPSAPTPPAPLNPKWGEDDSIPVM